MCFGIIRTTLGNMTKAEKYIHTRTLYTISGDFQTMKLSVKVQVKTITLRTIKRNMSQDESYAAGLCKLSRGKLEDRGL